MLSTEQQNPPPRVAAWRALPRAQVVDIEQAKVRGLKGLEYLDKVRPAAPLNVSLVVFLCPTSGAGSTWEGGGATLWAPTAP